MKENIRHSHKIARIYGHEASASLILRNSKQQGELGFGCLRQSKG